MLKDIVKRSRSYRGYDNSYKVTVEELKEIVDHTRYCPSSSNKQVIRYRLVFDEKETKEMQGETYYATAFKDIKLPREGKQPTAYIVLCLEEHDHKSVTYYQKDIGIVSQTMLLAATEMGLGGCIVGNFSAAKLRENLCLDNNIYPVLIVAIGKPDEEIVLKEVGEDGSLEYYRDENDVHYVPKKKLEDILV